MARVDQANCHPERLQQVDPIYGLIGTKCRLIMKDAVASANHVHAIWVSSSSATVCCQAFYKYQILPVRIAEGLLIGTPPLYVWSGSEARAKMRNP